MAAERYPFPKKEEAIETLKRDYCYQKIPVKDIPMLIDMSWNIGVDAAESFLKEYGDKSLDFVQVLKKAGIHVITEEKDYVSGQLRYFAEIQPKAKKVILYRDSVELWAKNNGYSYTDARNLILMHEYFHYLEETCLGYTSKKYQVYMLKLFGVKFGRTGIAALSEIAADAFAGTLFLQMNHEFQERKETVPTRKEEALVCEGTERRTRNRYAKGSLTLSILMILLNALFLFLPMPSVDLTLIAVPAAVDTKVYLVLSSLIFVMFGYQCIKETEVKKITFLSVAVFALCNTLLLFFSM